MNKVIQVFNNPEFGQIRTMEMPDGQVGFVGKDVAEVLGYAKSQNALTAHVDEDDKTTALIQGSGSNYKSQATIINESGLYALILSSKLPNARRFKHWVTSEVLPQIRRTGGYIRVNADDDDASIMARALMIANRTIGQKDALLAQKQAQLEEQKPMVRFARAVSSSEGSISIGELAKLIAQNGVSIGRTRLFRWLRENGYLFRHSREPMQKWVEKGLFEVQVSVVETEDGEFENLITKVTGKGQEYFVRRFLEGNA